MKIDQLVSQIVDLNIADGVQPCELTEEIFDKSYISISMKKDALSNLCLELSYFDDEDSKDIHTMRYKYDSSSVLFCIEQKINKGKFIVQWDRQDTLLKLYSEIKEELLKHNISRKSIDNFMSRLPEIKSYDEKLIFKLFA